MTSRFRVVPAAYLLLRRDGQVLLQLRQNTGYRDGHWACGAAGHVEAGESAQEAAVREANEELDIEVASDALTPLCAMHRTHGNGQPIDERVDFFFACDTWAGRPRIVEQHKCAALEWFGLTDLPDPVVPHEQLVLDHLRRGTLPAVVTFGFARSS